MPHVDRESLVCGTTASVDAADLATPIDPTVEAAALQILSLKAVPRRPKFLVSHLATDMGGSARHWQREFKLGNIWGFLGADGWETYWPYLVRYVAKHQNIVEMN